MCDDALDDAELEPLCTLDGERPLAHMQKWSPQKVLAPKRNRDELDGGWWLDPVIGLAIAAWSAWEGLEAWRGDDCC